MICYITITLILFCRLVQKQLKNSGQIENEVENIVTKTNIEKKKNSEQDSKATNGDITAAAAAAAADDNDVDYDEEVADVHADDADEGSSGNDIDKTMANRIYSTITTKILPQLSKTLTKKV